MKLFRYLQLPLENSVSVSCHSSIVQCAKDHMQCIKLPLFDVPFLSVLFSFLVVKVTGPSLTSLTLDYNKIHSIFLMYIVGFVPYSECLVIASIGKAHGRATSKLPGPHSNGMEKEISEIPELLNGCKVKHTVSLAPFWVEGQGRLNDVWVDDDMVSHSKEFYLALLQDFLQECRTPGGA